MIGARTSWRWALAALAVIALAAHPAQPPPRGGTRVAEEALSFAARLLDNYPSAVSPSARGMIRSLQRESREITFARWRLTSARMSFTPEELRARLAESDRRFETAGRAIMDAIAGDSALIRLPAGTPAKVSRTLRPPFRSSVLLFHRRSSLDAMPEFLWRPVRGSGGRIDLGAAPDFLLALEFADFPEGRTHGLVELVSGTNALVAVEYTVEVRPHVALEVSIRDSGGAATEAAAGLYSETGEFQVADDALDFSRGGFLYGPLRYRDHSTTKYWPGGDESSLCFFVHGRFRMRVPPGVYRLIVTKGPEYLPVDRRLVVRSNGSTESVVLRRWIDMPKRGWHSGDCHIHYARMDEAANATLRLWAGAEDIRAGNILRMGDALETMFEQYAFGKAGRHLFDGGALVSGQEDPRSVLLGHSMHLNISEPVREPDRYYDYAPVFDALRRLGGLSGYAHVNTGRFGVDRDLTLSAPSGRVDFVEICESGEIATDLYYEFLNLGFRLTAVAGSDPPWGGTIGEARVYAHTGRRFDPDEWFEAVRLGRTFVSLGHMLEFTVEDQLPGATITPQRGKLLRVRARARAAGAAAPAGPLEIVVNGVVVRSADSAAISFDLPAAGSMWVAARTRYAHSSPVYVVVEGERHWNRPQARLLIQRRLRTLDELDEMIGRGGDAVGAGHPGSRESAQVFAGQASALREAVRRARYEYHRLLELCPP